MYYFVSDNQFNELHFQALTIVDNFSRSCLARHAGKLLKGEDVVGLMDKLRVLSQRQPVCIQTDHGSEYISKDLDKERMKTG